MSLDRLGEERGVVICVGPWVYALSVRSDAEGEVFQLYEGPFTRGMSLYSIPTG